MKRQMRISRPLTSRIMHCTASLICIAFLCASFAGCGADATDSSLKAGGGSGGTGLTVPSIVSIGTVSDAERMEVNNIRFNTQQADVYIEDQYVGRGDEAVKLYVRYGYLSKVSGDIFNDTNGKANMVEIFHIVKGPLETVSVSETHSFEFQVMGQTVLGTSATRLEGFEMDTIQPGALLRVSGIVDGQGVIHAGHIVKVSDECSADSTAMVKGIVNNLDLQQKTFFINDLKIDYSEADLRYTPHDGSRVWVNGHCGLDILKADLVREFSNLNVQGADQFALEGFFTGQVSPNQWQMGNYLIRISDSTILEGNALDEIAVGMHARVHGVLDNFTIHASKIVFYEPVELQSLVTRIDQTNRTLELAGIRDVIIQADDNTNLFEAKGQRSNSSGSSGSAPYWVRVDRQGDTFRAYKRRDASSKWTSIGSATFNMVHNVYIGLCVTADAGDDDEMLNTAVFDNINVSTSGNSNWLSQDIGSVERTGRTEIDNGRFTIQASGKGISSRSDGFRYVYKPLNGDGSVEARVLQISNTGPRAKAGVMIRESLAGESPAVSVAVTPENGIAFQWRQSNILQRAAFDNLEIGSPVKIRGDFDNIDLVNAACIQFYDSEEHEDDGEEEHEEDDEDEHGEEDSTNGFYIFGPVKAPAQPFLTILGTTLDTSGYQFYEVDSDCSKCLKQELSAQEFFNALSPNAMVMLYGTKHEGRTVYEGVLLFNNPDCWNYCGW
jgi:hypothetical protein